MRFIHEAELQDDSGLLRYKIMFENEDPMWFDSNRLFEDDQKDCARDKFQELLKEKDSDNIWLLTVDENDDIIDSIVYVEMVNEPDFEWDKGADKEFWMGSK